MVHSLSLEMIQAQSLLGWPLRTVKGKERVYLCNRLREGRGEFWCGGIKEIQIES